MRFELKAREAKLRQDKIDNFSLSKEILKQLGIKPKVKYMKPKTIKFDNEKHEINENSKIVDWGKSLLRKNSDISSVFNYAQDPRVLT